MPDVDGDGILDIFLLDIYDNFSETGSFVAGFFDPVDLIEHEFSNQRDILYIDINPTLFYKGELRIQKAASTIAHELQHIIHANYETPTPQYTFINEGLSEFAEVLNGFSSRNPDYYFNQPNRALFSWNYSNPIPDYVRASMFFTYLFEQIGYNKAKHLVQHRSTIGYQSVLDFINEYSTRNFEEIFKDWGISLLTELNESTGYTQNSLTNISSGSFRNISNYPSTINYTSSPLSHSYTFALLTRELKLISNQHQNYHALATYPSRKSNMIQDGGTTFYADEAKHGSIWLLQSNLQAQHVESDTINSIQSVLFDGNKSSHIKELAYDDGNPDAFIGNASYLLLGDHQTEVAMIFSLEDNFWLSELTMKTVFQSEMSGSGVPSQSSRDIEIQIFSVKDNAPYLPITPALTHTFLRPFGNLTSESIPLAIYYEQLSSITDSIAVVIRNDSDDNNFVALGMDYSGDNHTLAKNNDGDWSSFEKISIGNTNLSGWNSMIRASAVVNEIQKESISSAIEFTNSDLQVSFNVLEEIDTINSVSAALSPSGLVFEGIPDNSNAGVGDITYNFPIQVGGEYTIISSLKGKSGAIYENRTSWSVPESADFKISNNYPNPFNPSTTIPFLLLEDGFVSVTAYDLIGRKVLSIPDQFYSAGSQQLEIDFAGLASGMYILKMDVNRSNDRGAITRIRKVSFVK